METTNKNECEDTSKVQCKNVKKDRVERWFDVHFEPGFFKARYIIIAPVICSFIGAILAFYVGVYATWEAIYMLINNNTLEIEGQLIKVMDAFLMGLILIIFSFGVYDLFVSKLDPAEASGIRPNWLKFNDVGELKVMLTEVILVILTILFFEWVQHNINHLESWSILVIPIGVLFIAVGIGVFKKLLK
ncbi:MAG: hypothetical protein CVT89_01545 [Candidatus Altiarchaeales archaeon HGW-Altiarchaeales-2]|nr:MAG: hypothetical protein CVT89_01545 [Candidatus Altiarchaeales archaeon HGW-Altiarchaeales-2]